MKGHLKCPPDTSYLCVCPLIDDFVITLSKWLWKYDPQASGSANFDNITDVVSVSFVFWVTGRFAYKSIRLHRGRFAYTTEVVSPTRSESIRLH